MRRQKALFLGAVRWGSRSGQLVLAPSYPAGGMMGDHLIFCWRANGSDRMISLHRWDPFRSVVATLRAIVLSATGEAAGVQVYDHDHRGPRLAGWRD